MKNETNLDNLVAAIGARLSELNQFVTTVESCTGGGIAHSLTALPGSSNWFEQGYITYSNAAKSRMVGVPESLIEKYGAVSTEVAKSMAMGALEHGPSDYALAVTGIAGPGGGSRDKPVGTVCFGWAGPEKYAHAERVQFSGNRTEVRAQSIDHSLFGLATILGI